MVEQLAVMLLALPFATGQTLPAGMEEVEIRTKVPRPTSEVRWREREETIVRPEYTTTMQDNQRVILKPVLRMHYHPYVPNWWNPFAPKYTVWQPVQRVFWEPEVQTVRTPVVTAKMVPETRMVKRQERVLGFTEHEQIQIVRRPKPPGNTSIARGVSLAPNTAVATTPPIVNRQPAVAASPQSQRAANLLPPPRPAATIADQRGYGGWQLESDPPRRGMRVSSPSDVIRR